MASIDRQYACDNEVHELRLRLADDPAIWHSDLLDSRRLVQLASEKGLNGYTVEIIYGLWKSGLLRADLVVSRRRITRPGIIRTKHKENEYHYTDTRKLNSRRAGYGGSIQSKQIPLWVTLYFHPFRLYILHQLDKVFASATHAMQFLLYPKGLLTLSERHSKLLKKWTSKPEFVESVTRWHLDAELAILLEPMGFPKVFHHRRLHLNANFDFDEAGRDDYLTVVRSYLAKIRIDEAENTRKRICVSAEMADDNKLIHILLRLTKWHRDGKVRGYLGRAMLFLAMAEIIRRAIEEQTGSTLPEEDELGFGQWMPGARESIFGTERVLDGDTTSLREFLSEVGIDYGTKARCYVEGETEFGAFEWAFGGFGGIELVH